MALLQHIDYVYQIAKANLTKRWLPLTVSLTVTNRCNLRCIYCYGSYYNRNEKDLPLEFWTGLIDEMAAMGTRLIHLEGGEPLLRDDIGKLISHVKSRNLICRLNTNGLLLPKKVNELVNLDSLCVSLDGDQEANDKNRGAGTYPKIIAGIKAARQAGIPVLTSTVLTSNNIESGAVEKILALATEIGFGAQFSFLYEQTTDRSSDPAIRVRQEAIRKTIDRLILYKKQGLPVFYSFATYRNAQSWPVSYDIKKFTTKNNPPPDYSYIPCYMGKLMCFVDGDTKVYPCGEHIGTFPALRITEVGFKRAWERVAEQKDCLTCYNTCFNEYNQVYSFNLGVLWNNFLNYRKQNKSRNP